MTQTLDTITVTGTTPGFKVRLSVKNQDGTVDRVIFEASSPIAESRTINYDGYGIIQLPTDVFSYHGTGARHFSITGKLVSRTVSEAQTNALYLNLIRSWALPDFGNTGGPPPIITLKGYNNMNIDNRPCILRSYGWTFPDDCDFIVPPTLGTTNEPMPVIGLITLELDEAYSPVQISNLAWKIYFNRSGATTAQAAAAGTTTGSAGSLGTFSAGIVPGLVSQTGTTTAALTTNPLSNAASTLTSNSGPLKDTTSALTNPSYPSLASITQQVKAAQASVTQPYNNSVNQATQKAAAAAQADIDEFQRQVSAPAPTFTTGA
jgi:hypothetical protein